MTGKMKVLQVSEYFAPHIGGVEKVVAEIAGYLYDKGIGVAVYCGKFKSSKMIDRKMKYKVIRSPLVNLPRLAALSFILFSRVFRYSKISEYDIVHAHNSPSLLAIPKIDKKIILTIHGNYPHSFKYLSKFTVVSVLAGIIENIAIRRADVITVVNSERANEIKRLHPNKKVYYIPNFVDTEVFKPLKINKEKNSLVYVGTLHAIKNVDVLIKSISIVKSKSKNVKLYVIGDGIQKGYLMDLVSKLGLKNNVFFEGIKNSSEIVWYYNRCIATILPSSNEGFPLVVLESLACGTPVIATATNEVVSLIRDKELLISCIDDKLLASKILHIFDKNKKEGFELRQSVIERYGKKMVLDKYLHIYLSLVSKRYDHK